MQVDDQDAQARGSGPRRRSIRKAQGPTCELEQLRINDLGSQERGRIYTLDPIYGRRGSRQFRLLYGWRGCDAAYYNRDQAELSFSDWADQVLFCRSSDELDGRIMQVLVAAGPDATPVNFLDVEASESSGTEW